MSGVQADTLQSMGIEGGGNEVMVYTLVRAASPPDQLSASRARGMTSST